MKGVIFTSCGVTSWGDTWEWTFDSGVELKAPDGHTLLITDLHTQVPEYNFEDDLFDRSFSMSQTQDAEWGQICWNCYLLESMIYSMVWESFKSCADQLIRDFKAKNPDANRVSDLAYVDMYATCLDAIKKQQGWGDAEFEWLFNYDGPISAAVDDWLTEALEEQEFQVKY